MQPSPTSTVPQSQDNDVSQGLCSGSGMLEDFSFPSSRGELSLELYNGKKSAEFVFQE